MPHWGPLRDMRRTAATKGWGSRRPLTILCTGQSGAAARCGNARDGIESCAGNGARLVGNRVAMFAPAARVAVSAEGGLSVILVEQHAQEALRRTDYAIVLERGRIVHEAPIAELLADL